MKYEEQLNGSEIAIIGMACQFPNAKNIHEFWQNLLAGENAISHFSKEELLEAGIEASQLDDLQYVKAKGVIPQSNDFDPSFFSYSDREAVLMDPQLRLYHECAWHAIEDAGYGMLNDQQDTLVSVFGGASANPLWVAQYADIAQQGGASAYEVINLISKDFFNTRLAYKFNFKGPAVNIQSACSTSLVAVHQAVQSLLSGESDIALAGAVSMSTNPALSAPEKQGYMYQEGMILSPDGDCRPFDESAQGTVLSDGVGFVVLKRLDEAIEDNDRIYCVIKGSAINNDGDDKVGFTAPSVTGQTEVLNEALTVAGLEPECIDFIESHGTGTNLGDPIELQALDNVYGEVDNAILLGAVKSNLGHLDTAAGMAGLIKSALSIYHKQVPKTLHYQAPNPKCQQQLAQFKVVTKNTPLPTHELVRAGVSSFGIGGTNAHVLLESYPMPARIKQDSTSALHILPISAKSAASLEASMDAMQSHLSQTSDEIPDITYSLMQRRANFKHRGALISHIDGKVEQRVLNATHFDAPNVYFMFTGQGSQYLGMGAQLYQNFPVYKEALDTCIGLASRYSDIALADLLCSETPQCDASMIDQTDVSQITIFCLEYALAKLLMSFGVKPKGLIGHSLGEYVAMCVAGMISLEQAIKLVIKRGDLMASAPSGSMIAVFASQTELMPILPDSLSVAAQNSEGSTVISGSSEDIERFKVSLCDKDLGYTQLSTSGGFHSALMEEIKAPFEQLIAECTFTDGDIPVMSNLTSNWLQSANDITSDYWYRHLRETVQFKQGISQIMADQQAVVVELGAGNTLAKLTKANTDPSSHPSILSTLPSADKAQQTLLQFYTCLAQLYTNHVSLDWASLQTPDSRLVSLPEYQFQRKTYVPQFEGFNIKASSNLSQSAQYAAKWHRNPLAQYQAGFEALDGQHILIIADDEQQRDRLSAQLSTQAQTLSIIWVTPGARFEQLSANLYSLSLDREGDFAQLMAELIRLDRVPNKILNFVQSPGIETRYRTYQSLMNLSQGLGQSGISSDIELYHVAQGMAMVVGNETLNPNSALAYGFMRVIGQEQSHITGHLIDIECAQDEHFFVPLLTLIGNHDLPFMSALRGLFLWTREFENTELPKHKQHAGFKKNGVYIISGGAGGLGVELAKYLAEHYQARLVLCGRSEKIRASVSEDITNLGGQAVYHSVDFTDAGAVERSIDIALTQFGEVAGIVHAAGVPGETMIHRQTAQSIKDVIESKVAPAQDMVSAVAKYNLDLVVFYSSVTAILGGYGQSEYCAANAYLDALTEQANSQGVHQVYAVNWDTWRDTGMAVNSLNGARMLELDCHPLLGDLQENSEEVICFKKAFDVESQWVLNEHWVMGNATVPGATYLEMVAAGFNYATDATQWEFEDVYFYAPLVLSEQAQADVYTRLIKEQSGYRFEVASYHLDLKQWHVHAKGVIKPLSGIKPQQVNLTELIAKHTQKSMTDIRGAAHLGAIAMGLDSSQEELDKLMKYGQRWNVFSQVWLGQNTALSELKLSDEYLSEDGAYQLHPAIIDCAVSFYRAFLVSGVYIPVSYGTLKQYQPLPTHIYSHIVAKSAANEAQGVIDFDVKLYDSEGALVVEIAGFTMQKISTDFQQSIPAPAQHIPKFVNQYKTLEMGLETQDALQRLNQLVGTYQQNTVIGLSNFTERLANAAQGDMGAFEYDESGPTLIQPRPEISVEYAAPITEAQKQTAQIWQHMLGLEKVGIFDDFFELGGDSLVLMQIHKKMQTELKMSLSVVDMYNYPTVAKLTEFLSASQNAQGDEALEQVLSRTEKQKKAVARRRKGRSNSRNDLLN